MRCFICQKPHLNQHAADLCELSHSGVFHFVNRYSGDLTCCRLSQEKVAITKNYSDVTCKSCKDEVTISVLSAVSRPRYHSF